MTVPQLPLADFGIFTPLAVPLGSCRAPAAQALGVLAGGLKAPGTGRVEPGSLSESVSNSSHFDLVRRSQRQ